MRSNVSILVTCWTVSDGWTTCLYFVPSWPSGGLKMRLNTGPVVRTEKSKYCRASPSLTCTGACPSAVCRLSVQYVARHDAVELIPRNGHRLNGMRSVGAMSNRVSPWSLVVTSSLVVLRSSVTYSLWTPRYSGEPPIGRSGLLMFTRGMLPYVVSDVAVWK